MSQESQNEQDITNTISQENAGQLVLVGTPIGNLSDMTPRAIEYLSQANVIACEDTRRTGKLLKAFDIATPMWPIHDHNETDQAPHLVERIQRGETICYVSDAGTPAISDPGYHLVNAVAKADLPVLAIPGPVAAIQALIISGLPTDRYTFEGFLPRKLGQRTAYLTELQNEPRTMIFYATPHRVTKDLGAMIEVFGQNRKATLVREITKKFEETTRGTLLDLLNRANAGIKGEIVIVVAGTGLQPDVIEEEATTSDNIVLDEVANCLKQGMKMKEASAHVAEQYGLSRREVYNLASKNLP